MFDSCEIRIHPTGSAIARLGTISQGQGHATTFAQILASEIGIPAEDITLEEGDTDTAPYGLGTYGSRSTPVAGAATAMAGRKIRAKAQMIAAYLLEVHDNDVEWDVDRFVVKGAPERFKTMKEIAFASYSQAIPGCRTRSRGGQLLRPTKHDLSVRSLYLCDGNRCRYRHNLKSASSMRWTIAVPGSTR
jgi:carbon-monoxide dehydrogenase large subunit